MLDPFAFLCRFPPHPFSDDEVEVTIEEGIEGEANGGANKGFD